MAKIDVIDTFYESYLLLRSHWKEVAAPLIVLLLLSGAGSIGSSSFNPSGFARLFSNSGSSTSSATSTMASLAASSSQISPEVASLLTGLIGILLILVVLVVVVLIAMALIKQATEYYIFQHFHSLLKKKKIKEGWQPRFKRNLIRAVVLFLFYTVILVAVLALPCIILYKQATSPAHGTFMDLLFLALALFLPALLLLVVINFLLSTTWIFYVLDNVGLIGSIRKSCSLVLSNLVTFIAYAVAAFLLGLTGALSILLSMCCCLSIVVAPVVSVFLTLLCGITLMKIKLALEK